MKDLSMFELREPQSPQLSQEIWLGLGDFPEGDNLYFFHPNKRQGENVKCRGSQSLDRGQVVDLTANESEHAEMNLMKQYG